MLALTWRTYLLTRYSALKHKPTSIAAYLNNQTSLYPFSTNWCTCLRSVSKAPGRTRTYRHVFALAPLGRSHPVGSQAAVSAGVLFGHGFKLLQQKRRRWRTLTCCVAAGGSAYLQHPQTTLKRHQRSWSTTAHSCLDVVSLNSLPVHTPSPVFPCGS